MRMVLCLGCDKPWGISRFQKIPWTGYECPKCASKRKRAPRNGRSKRAHNKNILSA
jgi:hypothetical protein